MLSENKRLWREFIEDSKSIDLSSFKVNENLNSDIWDDNDHLKPEISAKLIEIVSDFLKNLGLEGLEYEDITFTGSLANYNWSKYSDIDLHIIVDYSKIDENVDLVREFFRGKYGLWNKGHDIHIKGFEVEIYVQDSNEVHLSTGVYSVLNDRWIEEPIVARVEIDENNVKMKAHKLMCLIDCAKNIFYKEDYKESYDFSAKIKKKIKKFRQCGLETGGQYSSENLAFKVLRRNGYLGHLSDVMRQSYDRMMSISEDFNKKLRIFAKNNENEPLNAKKYQKIVKNINKNNILEQNQEDLDDERKQTAENILKFLDKSVGKAEKSLFDSINLIDNPETFDEFLVKTREIFVTAASKVTEFSKRVLGNEGILINIGDTAAISRELNGILASYSRETQQDDSEGDSQEVNEQKDDDVTKLLKALDSMALKNTQTRRHKLEFPSDVLDLSKNALGWLKQYKLNFRRMTGTMVKQKLDPVEVFSQDINANIFTEMRLVYAISHMLSKFSIVGKKDIAGPSEYSDILNSQFIKKHFESGRRLFNSQFKTFLKGSFAVDYLDKTAAGKVSQKPTNFKKALDIMKGGSLEESILRVESIIKNIFEEETGNFYSRLDRGGDLRDIFDCWSELADLDRKRQVDFLALFRSIRREKVENIINIMSKQAEKRELPCALPQAEPEPDVPEFELTQFIKPSVIKTSIKKIRKLTNIPFDTAGVINQVRAAVKDATAGGGRRDVRVDGGPKSLSEASQHPAVVSMSTLHKNLMQAKYMGDDNKVSSKKLSADDAWKIAQLVKTWLEKQKGANITVNESLEMKTNITNETENNMDQLINMANQFYPYSQKRLGFNKPVDIKLRSDIDNSVNPLGKTAYYDPAGMEIVLYTDNRHPKDLLRSFSHELVHHAQNCRGEFDKIGEVGEGYAQKDDHLREMEKEAYLEGNMILRDWEDSIKGEQ